MAEVNRSARFLGHALRQHSLLCHIYQSFSIIGTFLIVPNARFRTAGVRARLDRPHLTVAKILDPIGDCVSWLLQMSSSTEQWFP